MQRAIPLCIFLGIGIFASSAVFPWLLLAFACGVCIDRRGVATLRFFIQRLKIALVAIFLVVDVTLLLLLTIPFYLLGFTEELPCPRETISARLGRHALQGRAYAIILSMPIDLLFFVLGIEADHCKASALAYLPYWKRS